ncbi:MAG: R3H domain-containing nucleic acid-binding protein [Acidobacteriota bacterium]
MSDKQYFSGNNLRQAVLSAASQLGLEPDDLVYEEVKKKGGTLKGRKRVVIVVRGDGSSAEAAPRPEVPVATESLQSTAPSEPAQPIAQPGAVPVGSMPPKEVASTPDTATEKAEDVVDDEPIGEDLSAPLFLGDDDPDSDDPAAADDQGNDNQAAAGDPGDMDLGQQTEAPQSTPAPPAAAAEEATGRFAKAADQALIPLLQVAGLDIEAAIFQGEERLEIDFSGRDQDLLTAEKGELLQAVEHLMPRLIRGVAGETTAVRVDSDGFHAAREEELRQLALRLAREVKASGTPHSTGPLEPSDRRIVHIAVEHDQEIVSRSDGRGFRKKVTLRPA